MSRRKWIASTFAAAIVGALGVYVALNLGAQSNSNKTPICGKPHRPPCPTTSITLPTTTLPSPGTLMYRPPGWNGGDPMQASSFPGYTVYDVPSDGTNREFFLNTSTDYYVRIGGASRTTYSSGFGIEIHGGHNIVIVGGTIHLDGSQTTYSRGTHSLIIWNPTGTVHIEGVDMDSPYAGDGIAVRSAIDSRSPNWEGYAVPSSSVIQIENDRIRSQVPANAVDKPSWFLNIDHPDGFQFETTADPAANDGTTVPSWWDSYPGTVRWDKDTILTGYQGIATGTWPEGSVVINRVNIRQVDDGSGEGPGAAIYQEFRQTYTLTANDFWIESRAGKPLSTTSYTYPNLNGRTAVSQSWINAFGGGYGQDAPVYGTDAISNYREYPTVSNIIGKDREGVPIGGDYVPSGIAGSNYVSPGYQ